MLVKGAPVRFQAIIWTIAGLLFIGPIGTNFCQNTNIYIQQNEFENTLCKIAVILPQLQYLNSLEPAVQ